MQPKTRKCPWHRLAGASWLSFRTAALADANWDDALSAAGASRWGLSHDRPRGARLPAHATQARAGASTPGLAGRRGTFVADTECLGLLCAQRPLDTAANDAPRACGSSRPGTLGSLVRAGVCQVRGADTGCRPAGVAPRGDAGVDARTNSLLAEPRPSASRHPATLLPFTSLHTEPSLLPVCSFGNFMQASIFE